MPTYNAAMHRKIFFILLLFLVFARIVFAQSPGASQPRDCRIQPEQLANILSLSFMKFDQDQAGGWRVLADQGCRIEAVLLINAWLAYAPPELTELEKGDLYFHAGQLLAMTGENRLAAEYMLRSLNPQEPTDADLSWNAYVLSTVAFLSGDRPRLEFQRSELAAGKQTRENKINLSVVDGLRQCYGKPYEQAYGSACRPAAK